MFISGPFVSQAKPFSDGDVRSCFLNEDQRNVSRENNSSLKKPLLNKID